MAVIFWFVVIAAYLTHVGWTLVMLLGDSIVNAKMVAIMIIGLLFPPFGVIHGISVWF